MFRRSDNRRKRNGVAIEGEIFLEFYEKLAVLQQCLARDTIIHVMWD